MKMVWFPDWRAVLESSGLPGREVRSHGVVIRWYPGWLKRRHEPATVATARAFVAWAEEQKQPAEWMVRSWRAELRWFFVQAPERRAIGQPEMAAVGELAGTGFCRFWIAKVEARAFIVGFSEVFG